MRRRRGRPLEWQADVRVGCELNVMFLGWFESPLLAQCRPQENRSQAYLMTKVATATIAAVAAVTIIR